MIDLMVSYGMGRFGMAAIKFSHLDNIMTFILRKTHNNKKETTHLSVSLGLIGCDVGY